MGRFVIVAYKPKDGMDEELLAAVRNHLSVLREQSLVTNRPAYVMRAKDNTIIEVFEWRSAQAIAEAHSNVAVQSSWEKFDAVCEYTPLSKLAEAGEVFAEFDAIEL
jgi:hypothetical protein